LVEVVVGAEAVFSLGVSTVMVLFVVLLTVRLRRRRRGGGSGPGPGGAGAVYDLLNEDKRRAIEIIAEGQAEATDPERARDKNTDGEPGR
jgi:hypothetical protein